MYPFIPYYLHQTEPKKWILAGKYEIKLSYLIIIENKTKEKNICSIFKKPFSIKCYSRPHRTSASLFFLTSYFHF